MSNKPITCAIVHNTVVLNSSTQQLISQNILYAHNIVKSWVLICWWWRFDWSFGCLI